MLHIREKDLHRLAMIMDHVRMDHPTGRPALAAVFLRVALGNERRAPRQAGQGAVRALSGHRCRTRRGFKEMQKDATRDIQS